MAETRADINPAVTHRIALGVEYDGSGFSGWQRQASPELPTVQAAVESALSSVADHAVSLICAGRTDSGVHATGQVVHFDCRVDRGQRAWVAGSNSQLPESVRIKWASTPMPQEFHARFSATARRYLYLLYDANVAPAILVGQLTHTRAKLDLLAMQEAAQYLLGEQDFSSFRAAGCQSKTANRCVHWLTVQRRNNFIVIDVQANAFLQHMVRNIVGMLLDIGSGIKPPLWAKELLMAKDRTAGSATAGARGLYLVNVQYPQRFSLPQLALGPVFLQPYP